MSVLFEPEVAQQRSLRDYQTDGIEKLRESLRSGHKRPMLSSPTGSGKTRVATEIVHMAQAKGKRVIFCVPALSLIDQSIEAFNAEGLWDIGIVQAQHVSTDWTRSVQICSVQTLMRRWPACPEADMVIIDEAHIMFEHYGRWMTDPQWHRVPFIGLSATPWGKGLGKLFDDLITLNTTQNLIDQGYLSPFKVYAPTHPDLKDVRTTAGDYNEGDLGKAMNKNMLVADVVQTWLDRAEGRPTLCFAVDRAHAKHLQQQFEEAGVPCGYQDMNTTSGERREIKDRFHAGEYKVVANCDTLTVGVDWDVRCISLVRPTKSIMKFVQIIGRGLRTAPGKDHLIILDHSDNHLRLGFVTDISRDELDDGRAKGAQEKEVPLPKECPKCSYLRPPRVSECPNCGYKPVLQAVPQPTEGTLIELTSAGKPKPKIPKRVKGNQVLMGSRLIPKGNLYGELIGYAQQHGRKSGWASHAFKDLTGVWPNAYRYAEPAPPSMEVLSWIKSRNIAFAKARGKTDEHKRWAAD